MAGKRPIAASDDESVEEDPSATDTLRQAARVLGWPGVVVADLTLLGVWIDVVASVDRRIHAARQASGWGPITDPTVLAMWEDWPDQPLIPPSAVTLVGLLARGRRWRPVLDRVGRFVGFAATAVVLDSARTPTPLCLMNAHYYGIGVTRRTGGDSVELVQPGRPGPVRTARPTSISRAMEERVYQEILARGGMVAAATE